MEQAANIVLVTTRHKVCFLLHGYHADVSSTHWCIREQEMHVSKNEECLDHDKFAQTLS